MNEQEKQRRIDAWFNNFIQQVEQPPYSVNPDLSADVNRIYKTLDQPRADMAEMECPIGKDETLYDKRNELYQLASEGKLYIFHLAKDEELSQIRAESEGRLLYDLNEVAAQPATRKPVEQKLGFFKGFFKIFKLSFPFFNFITFNILALFNESFHKIGLRGSLSVINTSSLSIEFNIEST